MSKTLKLTYWITTLMLCAIMLLSAAMYFSKYEMVTGSFVSLGYPTYLVYPLAILKLLGIVAILTKKVQFLTEWAYAGFFFDLVLAFTAHFVAKDGGGMLSGLGLILLMISYFTYKKVFTSI